MTDHTPNRHSQDPPPDGTEPPQAAPKPASRERASSFHFWFLLYILAMGFAGAIRLLAEQAGVPQPWANVVIIGVAAAVVLWTSTSQRTNDDPPRR
jgi:hypothetical protein